MAPQQQHQRHRAATVGPLHEQVVRVNRASHAMRAQLSERHRQGGGDAMEWAAHALLFQLVHDGPKRSSALAEAACVDPSTVSRQVGDLVRAGLVERRPDPGDGRASLLAATEQGHRRCAASLERRLRIFARILDGWPEQDVTTLTALLTRFNDSFIANRPALLDELFADVRHLEETTA